MEKPSASFAFVLTLLVFTTGLKVGTEAGNVVRGPCVTGENCYANETPPFTRIGRCDQNTSFVPLPSQATYGSWCVLGGAKSFGSGTPQPGAWTPKMKRSSQEAQPPHPATEI